MFTGNLNVTTQFTQTVPLGDRWQTNRGCITSHHVEQLDHFQMHLIELLFCIFVYKQINIQIAPCN